MATSKKLINHLDIRIGTLAPLDRGAEYLEHVLPHGFESFQLTTNGDFGPINFAEHAKDVKECLGNEAIISSLGIYANPLQVAERAADWKTLIKNAHHYGCKLVCGFAGALEDRPVDESIPKFKEVFTELAKVAEGEGVRLAFENCDMGGTWERPQFNIAHSPRAWQLMFDAVPSKAIGLEWEPTHQMNSLIDPIPQLRTWVDKVFHVHGKDATTAWDVVEREGIRSGQTYVWHRTPGFGDTNWTDVVSILRMAGFEGAIDIEGWHDPVYRGELEMTGQVFALGYLQGCRGGDYVENPPEA